MTGSRTKLEIIGANLARLRTAKGHTRVALAESVGLDDSYYSKMERGLRGTSIENYEQLAAKLGVTVTELFAPPKRRPFRRTA